MGYLSDVVWKGEYKYYDSPEGKDCAKKIMYVTKYTGLYALGLSSMDIVSYSHPKGYAQILGRYAYITFPLMGIGATWAAATCAATNIRQKDDPLNYSIGALAAAGVCAAWRKSIRMGCYGGFFGALAAAVYKDMLENNWNIFSSPKPIPRIHIFSWSLAQDWTIVKDPGRTWKTSPNE